jgi:predicted metallo-beta-lactamase superfamily hydrolase
MRKTDAELLILDHHLLRDYRYPDLYCEIYKKAKKFGLRVCTAAEFVGKEPAVLSAYKRNGPTKWKEWREFKKEDVISVIKNAVDAGLIKKLWLSEVKRI